MSPELPPRSRCPCPRIGPMIWHNVGIMGFPPPPIRADERSACARLRGGCGLGRGALFAGVLFDWVAVAMNSDAGDSRRVGGAAQAARSR